MGKAALQTLSDESYDKLKGRLDEIGYPIGWKSWWPAPQKEQLKCTGRKLCFRGLYAPAMVQLGVGWLTTALAVMLGAPFWFDVLNKFMVIRATVKPREKSQEEGSEDRPASGGGAPAASASPPPVGLSAGVQPAGYVPNTWKDGLDGGVL